MSEEEDRTRHDERSQEITTGIGKQEQFDDTAINKLFVEYQTELDERYDKHERLVKLSRDITAQSKKVIFLLHRQYNDNNAHNDNNARKNKKQDGSRSSSILVEAKRKLAEIQCNYFHRISIELQGEDPQRFHRAYTGGVQEFIEGLLFYTYLKTGRLLSFLKTQYWLTLGPKSELISDSDFNRDYQDFEIHHINSDGDDSRALFPLTTGDYVLGVADLTGELMRLAVNAIGSGNKFLPFTLLSFLREIQMCFLSLKGSPGHLNRDIHSKLNTLNECVNKVERACYNVKLREAEKLFY